jgi:alanine racemase
MVKAFSYGSGSYEIANLLQFHHVDYLAVAYADEGVELRKAGISMPIMVMNPDEESVDALSKYQLEPEVYSFRVLRMIAQNRKELANKEDGQMSIHLKVETGMNRLGFNRNDLPGLMEELVEMKGIRVASVFSHLAASQDPQHDEFTQNQIQQLQEMAGELESGLGYSVMKHILNSAGIQRFPEAQFDMVRMGISLYGIQGNPDPMRRNLDLLPVSKLRTAISQIKTVKAGESIGYNRAFVAGQDMTIAVIPIGYADGLSRILGNGRGHVMIKDQLCSILGDVCMDMCMVDVSSMDVHEEDDVIIFGPERPITQLAEEMQTIPYEVLTGISRRVKRVYYQE